MWVLTVLSVLIISSSQARDLPQELFYSLTYRDFLPTYCLFNRDAQGAQIVRDAWNLPTHNSESTKSCDFFDIPIDQEGTNQWPKAIASGKISGHPDFEAQGFIRDSDECNVPDPSTGLDFPAGSCTFEYNQDGQGFRHALAGTRLLPPGKNGLQKLSYCDDSDGENTRCGLTHEAGRPTQTEKKFFDIWYQDDETYNKRIGQRMRLHLKSKTNDSVTYSIDTDTDISAVDFPDDQHPGFFGPFDMFKLGGSREIKLTTSIEDAPAWPQTYKLMGPLGYWFTTELHTTFEYRADTPMLFSFDGDDDFWAYINGQLTVDIGGLHPKRHRSIDLNAQVNGNSIAKELNLVDKEVYTLDIFHAERQTFGKNFGLTTSLASACNVVQSGTSSFNFVTEDIDTLTGKFQVKGMTINENKRISIQKSTDTFTSGFVFSKQEENVIRGFDTTFLVTVSRAHTFGFAFVLQGVGVDDLPLVSGESFNIDGLQKSLAIVFDLCVDRGENDCKDQEVRLHHADNATEGNSPRDATKRVNDRILRNVKRDEAFPVQIIYFGGRPDFLEVYVNHSLYLRQDNFGQILENLDIEGAHVGFTTSSAEFAADITIENFNFTTVQVEPPLTTFDSNSSTKIENIIADGEDVSKGIKVKTFDLCGNQLDAGTLQNLFDAFYIKQPNVNREFSNETTHNEPAVIFDNGDGTYQLSLRTVVPGSYSLVVAFGDGCHVQFNNESVPNLTQSAGDHCFYAEYNNGKVVSQAFPPEIKPTASPVKLNDGDNAGVVVLTSSIAGGISLLGICAGIAFFGFYRSWSKKKGYIEQGNMYRLDLTTAYTGNEEYQVTGKRLLETQQEILALQAAGKNDGRAAEIKKLQDANTEMKAIIKQNEAAVGVEIPKANVPMAKRKKKGPRTEF